ncbi:MAG: type I-U CRISPR-associated helicase/endonuclease Cas3 [Fibrobacteres bacterium]|nr:type I-U CRISPR-associated helicase/endonuclease Cas3 [Fibrobacterota bacterium]
MLTTDRFGEYFQSVHGSSPFPWQQRLLDEVVETGKWPSVLSLPTGTGKTAILDISLFALACGAKVPRRTILVVDRRIVVDDAYRRAEVIRSNLSDGVAQILVDVREALCKLGGRSPVETALLRGGIYREDNWVRDPLQPTLVCSTVDQVGSRLLHQGYGVSPHSRSIHAGLLANDTLIVLDEAHTSESFRQTLAWVDKFRLVGENVIPRPFAVVTMTATPRGVGQVFSLSDADRLHPVLSQRWNARKVLNLVQSTKPKDDGLVDSIVKQVVARLAGSEKSVDPNQQDIVAKVVQEKTERTVLVVVNRVKTARMIAEAFEKLRTARKETLAIEKPILLTGRSRPLERETVLNRVANRLYSGRDRDAFAEALPLLVVATQCVEVGADLDVDLLISEACPLDSLRQRLGRLDRLGKLGHSVAVVVAPREKSESKPEDIWIDPVYGEVSAKTWQWLLQAEEASGGALNVGLSQWEHLLTHSASLDELQTVPLDAPVMFPAYCDLWVQTSPAPSVVPDPSLFLHGPQHGEPEVQILWRGDLDPNHADVWGHTISACPPVAGEALRLPLYLARQWLDGKPKEAVDGSDLEGEARQEEKPRKGEPLSTKTPFLRWFGSDESSVHRFSAEVRPGDTLVVPASSGGCDEWGWAPESTEYVHDLADTARWKARRIPVLRIHEAFLKDLPSALSQLPLGHSDTTLDEIQTKVKEALASAVTGTSEATDAAIESLRRAYQVQPHPGGKGWILVGKSRMTDSLDDFTGEDDSSSQLPREISLAQHLRDVRRVAQGFAVKLSLPQELCEDLALAGWLHDLGKSDLRFQAMLHGNRFSVHRVGLLAKSPKSPGSLVEAQKARRESGYPEGGRHELLSVRLAESSEEIRKQAHDWDLVLHLIASHHGRCRPFAPVVVDEIPRIVSLEFEGQILFASSDGRSDGMGLEHIASGVAERFWILVRRYGWWGLSYLEACLRLADWRASELEAKGEEP